MHCFRSRVLLVVLATLLLIPLDSFALDTPLSDTAVREAYFIGQRHDESLPKLLEKYTRHLPIPKTGPYIQSVTFLTPYAFVALNSSQHIGIYSAQQAQLDHKSQPEFVRITVEISLTPTYGPYIAPPLEAHSSTPNPVTVRSSEFWKDFRIRAFNKDDFVIPIASKGESTNFCSDRGECTLSGAIVTFDYPAGAFTNDTATIQIDPPEGDSVVVEFNLNSLR